MKPETAKIESAKHTPGPWEVRGSWVFPKGQDDDICHMSESYLRSGKVRFANADLIATAPDMLQTLKHIQDLAEENTHSVQDGYCQIAEWARNQLAKAEGRDK